MAHPTLTPAIEHAICVLVSEGVPLTTAARMAGVPPRTVRTWMVYGRQEDAAEHWIRFRDSVLAARTEHRMTIQLRLEQLRVDSRF